MNFFIVLAIALGVVSVTLSLVALSVPKDKQLRRGFEALEEEFDDLKEQTRSTLGRVSRLKRSIMHGEVLPQEPAATDADTTAKVGGELSTGLNSRQLTVQEKILARRRGVQ